MKQVTRIFLLITLTWLIAACGGGGSLQREDAPTTPTSPDPTTPAPEPTEPVIALAIEIVDDAGSPKSELIAGSPLLIRVTATSDDAAITGALITFALSDSGLATFGNDTGTALTNSDGTAEIELIVGDLSGSGTVTASYSEDDLATIGFNSAGAEEPTNFTLDLSASGTTVASGAPFILEAKVTDDDGLPVSNEVVSFSINLPELAFFNNDTGSALTNDEGIAQISVFLGQSSGSGIITATLGSVSDSIGFESAGSSAPNVILLDLSASSTVVTQSEPLLLEAKITDETGAPIINEVVAFTISEPSLATFNNTIGTALTDSQGIARITLLVGEASGSGRVTASVEGVTDSLGFESTGTVEVDSVELDFTANGTVVSAATPLILSVVVTNELGEPIVNKLVSFTISNEGLGIFENDTASALTNAQGLAQISLAAAELSGSGLITATVDDVSATLSFESTGSAPPTFFSISLSASNTELADGSPISLIASVTNDSGVPIENTVVSFEIDQPSIGVFGNDTGTALTDAQGQAQITLFVGEASGSGTVTATVGEISASLGFTSAGPSENGAFSLELFANTTQLASSGSDLIELIAVTKSDANVLLSGVQVSFSANQDASLSIISAVSGPDGTARATLSTANKPENREIEVIATSGTEESKLTVLVIGTEININGPSSIILNDSAPITFVLSDSDGNGIAGQEIVLTTDKGQLDELRPVTNANGQVSVLFTATESGVSQIRASALNAVNEPLLITVQQDDFSFTSLPGKPIELGDANSEEIELTWFRNNQPFVNGSVEVTASRGVVSVNGNKDNNIAITNDQGIATFTISSSFAGPSSISAIGTDNAEEQVTARASLEFIATEVDSIFVDATPDIIGPEGQTSTITAIVRDPDGNLVKGKAVNFRLFADSTGGSITPNTAMTDSNGIASTVYTSSAVSPIDGVTIEAESDGVTALADLTVGDRAFDISIGTGNEIASPDQSSYVKEFAVFVTDAAGRPINGAQLTANASPPLINAYEKGQWIWFESSRIYRRVGQTLTIEPELTFAPIATCNSEDSNGNGRLDGPLVDVNGDGILDAAVDRLIEDTNSDGQLTPGNVASVTFKDGIARTDANGQATVEVRYAKQFGGWVNILLSINGQTAGTESSETQRYKLGVAADDLTEESSPPPPNPFGVLPDCSSTL